MFNLFLEKVKQITAHMVENIDTNFLFTKDINIYQQWKDSQFQL